jgi:hypothetical protein
MFNLIDLLGEVVLAVTIITAFSLIVVAINYLED